MHGTEPGEEQRHLANVERELLREFPQLSPDDIHRQWLSIVAEFDGAPIRDFVPVLARKRAQELLRSTAI